MVGLSDKQGKGADEMIYNEITIDGIPCFHQFEMSTGGWRCKYCGSLHPYKSEPPTGDSMKMISRAREAMKQCTV